MTIFISDTFNRADGSGWGTADGGEDSNKSWNGGTTDWTISSNTGKMITAWGGRNNYVGDNHAEDIEVQVDMQVTATADNGGTGVIMRMQDVYSYSVRYERATALLILQRRDNVSPGVHTLASVTVSDMASCTLKVQISTSGSAVTIKARMWTGTEPGTWDINYTDTSGLTTAGLFGLGAYNSNGSGNQTVFDNYSVKTISSGSIFYDSIGLSVDSGVLIDSIEGFITSATLEINNALSFAAASGFDLIQISNLVADIGLAVGAGLTPAGQGLLNAALTLAATGVYGASSTGQVYEEALALVISSGLTLQAEEVIQALVNLQTTSSLNVGSQAILNAVILILGAAALTADETVVGHLVTTIIALLRRRR